VNNFKKILDSLKKEWGYVIASPPKEGVATSERKKTKNEIASLSLASMGIGFCYDIFLLNLYKSILLTLT